MPRKSKESVNTAVEQQPAPSEDVKRKGGNINKR
jgi:hypothetical protein|tara:strand:+ start:2907 stop:3008 length:102 start_codon:yes stop_codon:yes gene_type:complete